MCWSGEASAVLASAGLGTTAYAAYHREPSAVWMPLGYFALMELLQAFTYSVIDQCGLPSNQIATLMGYLHITFQPFFINMVSMYFIPQEIRSRIAPAVYALCFVSAIIMLLQLYPFAWAGQCDPSTPLCGTRLCSVHGNWHLAWEVPTNGMCNAFANQWAHGFPSYVIAGIFLPVLYGSWRMTVFHLMLGPWLAALSTDNINEWPAVWCLLSIGLLAAAVKTPIRRFLHVRKWWLWPPSWRADRASLAAAAGSAD
jgi:Family of unknown function (DUF5765)